VTDDDLLRQTVVRILADHCSPQHVRDAESSWDPALWHHLESSGLTTVGVPESSGGSGGDLSDAASVVRLCAASAAPVPIAQTLLVAPWLRTRLGLDHRLEAASVSTTDGVRAVASGSHWQLSGRATAVPWARSATSLLILASTDTGQVVAEVLAGDVRIEPHSNLAGEPRDSVVVDDVVVSSQHVRGAPPDVGRDLRLRQALAQTVLLAGALDQVLELSRKYVTERVQFGRPLAAFQAVKHQVALLAGQVAVAGTAADAAVQAAAASGGESATVPIMAARVRTARSATEAATIAHQLHGAMGFTHEHELQHFTRRLWSWRDEHGTEGEWEHELGRVIAQRGPDQLWPSMVT
jgi:acyl-CoA dehydrogenase